MALFTAGLDWLAAMAQAAGEAGVSLDDAGAPFGVDRLRGRPVRSDAGRRTLSAGLGAPARARRAVSPGKLTRTASLPGPRIHRAAESESAPAIVDVVELTGGEPLPSRLRAELEAALGFDLDAVRIHTGADADRVARTVHARAFAIGRAIGFRSGAYDPTSPAGVHLIAHEVIHTTQAVESSSEPAPPTVSRPDDPAEREADAFADRFAAARRSEVTVNTERPRGAAAPLPRADARTVLRAPSGEPAPPATPAAGANGAVAGGDLDSLIKAVADAVALPATTPVSTTKAKRASAKPTAAKNAQDAARRKAVTALAAWCRSHVPDPGQLDQLLIDTSITATQKVAVLGQCVAQVARMEMLLGWMSAGGVDQKTWEGKEDMGEFPEFYQKQAGTSKQGGAHWCTSFAGYSYQTLGLDPALFTAKNQIFASGYRLDRWATTGKNNHGKKVSGESASGDKPGTAESKKGSKTTSDAPGKSDGSEGDHDETLAEMADAAYVGKGEWAALTRTLKAAGTKKPGKGSKSKGAKATVVPAEAAGTEAAGAEAAQTPAEARRRAVAEFFETHPVPQPGDLLVLGIANDFKENSASHTAMVDTYDEATFTITTVEGNANDAVGARRLVLTEPSAASQMVMIARPGARHYERSAGAGGDTDGQGRGPGVGGAAVLASIKDVVAKLVKLASDQGWIKSADATAPATEWLTGKGKADAAIISTE